MTAPDTPVAALDRARQWERTGTTILGLVVFAAAFMVGHLVWLLFPVAVAIWCWHRGTVLRAWDRGHFEGRWSVLEEQRAQQRIEAAGESARKLDKHLRRPRDDGAL